MSPAQLSMSATGLVIVIAGVALSSLPELPKWLDGLVDGYYQCRRDGCCHGSRRDLSSLLHDSEGPLELTHVPPRQIMDATAQNGAI